MFVSIFIDFCREIIEKLCIKDALDFVAHYSLDMVFV